MSEAEVAAYLNGVDSHLATLNPIAAIAAIEEELARVAKVERALSRWAAGGGAEKLPTRFSALQLSRLDGELRIRKEKFKEGVS
jgi:hypothetical protein